MTYTRMCRWTGFSFRPLCPKQCRGGSRERVQGVRTPPPPLEMTCGFLIQLVFCEKKTMWFIGVEVEQETSAPSPKKNPGSAPAVYTVSLKSFLNREGNTIEGFVRNRVCILGMCVVLLLLYWRQQKVYFLSLSWKVWRAITCKHALCTSVTDCHSALPPSAPTLD